MGEKGARLTSASESFQEDIVARLDSIGRITSRKMFGAYKKAASKQHRPKPYSAVAPSVLQRKASLQKWAREAIAVAHAGKLTKKK